MPNLIYLSGASKQSFFLLEAPSCIFYKFAYTIYQLLLYQEELYFRPISFNKITNMTAQSRFMKNNSVFLFFRRNSWKGSSFCYWLICVRTLWMCHHLIWYNSFITCWWQYIKNASKKKYVWLLLCTQHYIACEDFREKFSLFKFIIFCFRYRMSDTSI